jgi:thioredoxin-dependent peroxiredoxin
MSIRSGHIAPNFQAATTHGPIDFHEWIGDSWTVLLSRPQDFRPAEYDSRKLSGVRSELAKRGAKVIGISVDGSDVRNPSPSNAYTTGSEATNFPVIQDTDCEIAQLYGIAHTNGSGPVAARSVVVISPEKKVTYVLNYPAGMAGNFDVIFSVIDALQLRARRSAFTPAMITRAGAWSPSAVWKVAKAWVSTVVPDDNFVRETR